jgi:DNA mismatch endonuclease (patch repair protein)
MADVVDRETRSRIMAAIRSSGNRSTELRMVAILRAARIRGWRRRQRVTGRPDFVFWRERVAVFVDGCFWHGCPRHCRMPEGRREYWEPKIRRNRRRDRAVDRELRNQGWVVARVWEHDLDNPRKVAHAVALLLRRRRRVMPM